MAASHVPAGGLSAVITVMSAALKGLWKDGTICPLLCCSLGKQSELGQMGSLESQQPKNRLSR